MERAGLPLHPRPSGPAGRAENFAGLEVGMELALEILEAYRRTGFKPVSCSWGKQDRGTACGLGVLCFEAVGRIPRSHEEAAAILGLDLDFVRGFTFSWDSQGDSWSERKEEFYKGWGVATRAKLALAALGRPVKRAAYA